MGISPVISSFNSAHSTAEPSSLKLYHIASLVQKLTAPGVDEGNFDAEFANLPEMESLVGQILKDAMSLSQPTPANLASIRFMLGELQRIAPQNVHSVACVAAHFSTSSEVNEIFEQAQKENTPGAYEPTSPEAARKEAEETENERPSYWTRGLGVGLIALVTIAGGTALYRSLQNGAPKPAEPSLGNDAPIAGAPSQPVCHPSEAPLSSELAGRATLYPSLQNNISKLAEPPLSEREIRQRWLMDEYGILAPRPGESPEPTLSEREIRLRWLMDEYGILAPRPGESPEPPLSEREIRQRWLMDEYGILAPRPTEPSLGEVAQVDFPRPQESLGLPPGLAGAGIIFLAYKSGVVDHMVFSPLRKITEILRSPARPFITKIAEVLARAYTYWTESGPRIGARSPNAPRNRALIRELVVEQRRRQRPI